MTIIKEFDEQQKIKIRCVRCNWAWLPRKRDVRICPHCHTIYWDIPKVVKNKNIKREAQE